MTPLTTASRDGKECLLPLYGHDTYLILLLVLEEFFQGVLVR